MFKRDRGAAVQDEPVSTQVVDPGKGRATPKRRDAERERKERVKPTGSARQKAIRTKQARAEERKAFREGVDRGDARYLPNRDKGPVRKFIRDFVDGRITAAEFFMPIAVASLVFMLFGAGGIGGSISTMMILVVMFDGAIMSVQVRKAVRKKFPDESTRGAVSYAIMRALVWRSMRTPKPQVPRGYKPS